jgi:hypothetical protein
MKTESKKRYTCGFKLTEGELRRLHDVLVQQIKRTPVGEEFKSRYELKYRNGSVALPSSLDEVLKQENFGSAAISRLRMDVYEKEEKSSTVIAVQFLNPDEDEWEHEDPIRYAVVGDDRDWVFLTSSQLDERIGKIKLFTFSQLFSATVKPWAGIMIMTLILIATLTAFIFSDHPSHIQAVRQLDSLQSDWKAGKLNSPEEAIIRATTILLNSKQSTLTDRIFPMILEQVSSRCILQKATLREA